jgi:hypothetical protein
VVDFDVLEVRECNDKFSGQLAFFRKLKRLSLIFKCIVLDRYRPDLNLVDSISVDPEFLAFGNLEDGAQDGRCGQAAESHLFGSFIKLRILTSLL